MASTETNLSVTMYVLRHEYVLVLMVRRATVEVILSRSLSNGVQPKLKYSGVASNWIAILWERVKK